MDTYLKLSSTKNNKNCNCISPFYINNITGINPNTGREYSKEDKDILKTSLYRISNAKGCNVSVCCDPNDPTSIPDAAFTDQFIKKFPKIMPMYTGRTLTAIKLSTTADVKQSGWIDPKPYMICKITKATIIDDKNDPTIKIAVKLVNDCFTDQCNQAESISVSSLLQNSKIDMKYTFIDDARVSQAIREGNITYVKTYIRQYKKIDLPLTNDEYNNRMIHIASESKSKEIINMLVALKANLNIKNKLKETPMHFAVRSKNIDNIDALLAQGVDLTIKNSKGETPMFYAIKTGDMRIINMLYNGGSTILDLDNKGNNLIHYCVMYSPTYKDIDPNLSASSNDSSIVYNSKSEIIKFLIEHGLSTEHKNADGLSPLELTSKQINKEINKKCADNNEKQTEKINEAFFNIKPIREAFESFDPLQSGSGGASQQVFANDTLEHNSLLEIQTMLFNNIIKNNPNKYNRYISVDEIPKGAPIEVLDTVCVGDGMTGNEDSEDCMSKGGKLVKIKNRTTKIKLELIPDDDISIDAVDQKDLYFNKDSNNKPILKLPENIQQYNDSVKNAKQKANNLVVPQTTGITYNLGQTSSNLLDSVETSLGFNPQPTKASQPIQASQETQELHKTVQEVKPTKNVPLVNGYPTMDSSKDHPPMFDDTVLHKCKADAIRNSTKITQSNVSSNTNTTITTGNISSSNDNFISRNFKIILALFITIIILIIAYIFYTKLNM
jgi:ankyrin repeat protein